MRIFRTTGYRGKNIWYRKYCLSRRQFAAKRQDLRYLTRMTLEVAEIPDGAWVIEQSLEDEY